METLLLSYFAAIILLTITPGVDTALIIRTASVEGRRQALWAAAGINLGCLAWGIAAAFGLGAILAASETAFTVLKWCGALYLIWLGLQLLFSAKAQDFTALPEAHAAQPNWFVRGFTGNLLNPKVGIFYISFLPQFIPSAQHAVVWTLALVAVHIALGVAWSAALIAGIGKIRPYLLNQKIVKWMNRITGGLFIAFALKLAQAR